MKRYLKLPLKNLLIVLVAIILITVFAVLVIRYYIAPRNVNSSIKSAISLSQASQVTNNLTPTEVKCAPSEFETVCQSKLTFGANGKPASYLKNYIQTATASLKSNGWGAYIYDSDNNGNRYIYRSMGVNVHKLLASNYCSVVISFNSADPAHNGALTYYQSISCSQSLPTFGLF
jgi:uncharacterized protein YxeA